MVAIAFVFPGQGSQYVGMGKELAENFSSAARVFDTAQESLGVDISGICFIGPEDTLKRTYITQPAVFCVSLSVFAVISEMGIIPTFVAGHSLGEYSALAAAGTFSFTDALQLVARRGQLMAEAVPEGKGSMAAILGLAAEKVQEICNYAAEKGVVIPANYNSPGQVVISGEKEAVDKAAELAAEMGAKRVVHLQVSGPFHSPLMDPVREELEALLNKIPMKEPKYGFVANTTGGRLQGVGEIKSSLVDQVSSPVLWQQSVEYLISQGVSVFVELGPGRVLSGLIRNTDRKVKVINVEDCRTLEEAVKVLKGVERDAE